MINWLCAMAMIARSFRILVPQTSPRELLGCMCRIELVLNCTIEYRAVSGALVLMCL